MDHEQTIKAIDFSLGHTIVVSFNPNGSDGGNAAFQAAKDTAMMVAERIDEQGQNGTVFCTPAKVESFNDSVDALLEIANNLTEEEKVDFAIRIMGQVPLAERTAITTRILAGSYDAEKTVEDSSDSG